MDEPKEGMSTNHGKKLLNPFAVTKPKKRSIVERELETNMTARITSPATVLDGESTSRYGRARRSKFGSENRKSMFESLKSLKSESIPVKIESPITKEVIISPFKTETPIKALKTSLDNVDNIFPDTKSPSHEEATPRTSSAKNFSKVYIRKDLIQNREEDDNIILIKDLFSPKSGRKQCKVQQTSSQKHNMFKKQNSHIENTSVVKALDFDANKGYVAGAKRDSSGNKQDTNHNKRKKNEPQSVYKNLLSKVEEFCPYQAGDLAWARMGTFPFWPCIITRDPESEIFVRKKLFGRVEHYILHVTFLADNGRRSWVVDNMLRKYMGLDEFVSTRDKFTNENKKNNPRLYSAFFISEKKQSLWKTSVDEAEMLSRAPKSERIDTFNELLHMARASKKQLKTGKVVTRTDSDVSLSESLYDSLFSEENNKADDSIRSQNRTRNKSLDVSDVVTACLDNMAAKTGNIKIQKQSHMDRWLQKAKSKTPEKVKTGIEQAQPKTPVITPKIELVTPNKFTTPKVDKATPKKTDKPVSNNKKKKLPPKEVKITKVYSLRRSYESQNSLINQSENKESEPKLEVVCAEENDVSKDENVTINTIERNPVKSKKKSESNDCPKNKHITDEKKVLISTFNPEDSLNASNELLKSNTNKCSDGDNDDILNAINELLEDSSTTSSNYLISKRRDPVAVFTNKDNTEEKILVPKSIDSKSDVMDVDKILNIKVKETPAVTPDVINDSPIKTEIELTLIEERVVDDRKPVQIDCDSPVKTETESSGVIKTVTNPNSKNEDCAETVINSLNECDPISPTFKRNEMVSIPENCEMTDDDSNLMTSTENYVDIQDHNSNLTNVSAKSKNDTVDVSPKEMGGSSAEMISLLEQDVTTENLDKSIQKNDLNLEKAELLNEQNDMSIDEVADEDVTMNEKDFLNESGQSASILQIDDEPNDNVSSKVIDQSASVCLNGGEKSISLFETCKNDVQEVNSIEIKQNEKTLPRSSNESNPFLGDIQNIDVYKDVNAISKDTYFREVNLYKPPDLTIESLSAKADLLQNVHDSDSDIDEDSDDEPSPEYEPLGEEITEDFRQHMKCIESSITDKKDEAQLVKVCNDIAIIEESKAKLTDNTISPNASLLLNNSLNSPADGDSNQRIVKEEKIMIESKEVESEKVVCVENMKIDVTKTSDKDVTNDTKYEILDGLNIMKKAVENKLKSPSDKKKHKLSLTKNKIKYETNTNESVFLNENTINSRYKTIDQIEEIMKNKPKRLPIENGEVRIPEIKENGYHPTETDAPDQNDDDFDIDKASVNSEDSEVSLPHEKVPARRSLRARPRKGGLEDPEFLAYMELRQDDLIEQHPELSIDDIVLYLYKTYAYSQNLASDVIEETAIVKSIKQETPSPPQTKSKKSTQPKNTIENFLRIKYKNAFESERLDSAENSDSNKVKHKKDSISPVNSSIGNSNDSIGSDVPITKRKTKSPPTDITKDVKIELLNDVKYKDATSPKTPKRQRKKTISPRVLGSTVSKISPKALQKSMNKRVPVVVISPIKDDRIKMKLKYDNVTKHTYVIETSHSPEVKSETDTEMKHEPITETDYEPALETVSEMKQEPVTATKHKLIDKTKYTFNETNQEPVRATKHQPVTETNQETTVKTVTKTKQDPVTDMKHEPVTEVEDVPVTETKHEPLTEIKRPEETETESIDSDSEISLRQLRTKVLRENQLNELKNELLDLKDEIDDKASVSSENEPLLKLKPKKVAKSIEGSYEDPEFLQYLEMKQETLMEENPQLSQNEIKAYLYKTWIYEKSSKSDIRKIDDVESSNLVKSLNQESAPPKKARRKPKTEKNIDFRVEEIIPKEKPKRKTVSHYYNEAFLSDIEDELEVFEIFKTKKASITVVSKSDSPKKEPNTETNSDENVKTEIENNTEEINTLDEIELYFKQLTSPKPSVFKGLIREKVCEVCEDIANLIKCKGCNGTFHYDCVTKVVKTIETPPVTRGRKKKKKVSRKPKNLDDSDHSDDQDASAENLSIEETPESITIDAETLESQLEAKMKELLEKETQLTYDSYSSDDGIDWTETLPGKCELVDVKVKQRTPPIDISNFKCNACQKHDTPICFVCKSDVSKNGVKVRQKCSVAHCHSYYHVECLDHWPQTQFNTGSNKKASGLLEALTCPRHVCHSCVSDDPRGCKTRFSGDKLAKCVRCPATYHSFNKCLPAGTQILTASLIICPRHYEHRPGKVPCHVNTGWCFICALGGSLICCEYCPTSFHAECLNIKPPEGNYMCEDCETGRLPLYGEMVWVKLGHYRWWPGVILHPSEIPDNIMAAKHGLGEFVVRFFGQYDHYWVNRGRVFPYQEGDSGRISSQKSKIDLAFTTAMEHAQRAIEILKNAEPDDEESLDIASSLLPPHYVKLKCNKPIGSLLGRKIEDPSLSLTQCECNPAEIEPCGPNSQCINRMLLTECGPTCRAGDRCNNRAFEKRLYPKLTPYKALHRGWGLKTLEDIKAGQFVIEYVGELLDEHEFQMRMARKHEIRDENFYFLTLDKERMIDAGPKGNLARFMNHCCEPNCETQKWTVLGDIRVGLFAIHDIKANSEVTFNYNLECTGIEKKRCLCGAKRCSGYIGAKPKQLDESLRKKNGTLTGKRKYTKRKNIEVSPTTVKNKVKRLGRPPKPKELTEIEKDLLIIKSATTNSSSESSRSQSVEGHLIPVKRKTESNSTDSNSADSNSTGTNTTDSNTTDSNTTDPSATDPNTTDPNTTDPGTILSTQPNTKAIKNKTDDQTPDEVILNGKDSVECKLDCNTKNKNTIPNVMLPSRTLKRKLDPNIMEDVAISSAEPSVKRQKCYKEIEVGEGTMKLSVKTEWDKCVSKL